MARLSKKKRQHIKRRAKKETAREYSGSNAASRGAIASANRTYGRDVRDARGAQRVETSQLSHMLSNIRSSGLKGRYAKQTANELRSRKMDAISGVPYAVAQAQEARRDTIADAQSSIAQNAADRQAAEGKRLTDLLTDARKNKQDRIETRRSKKADSKPDEGVQNALLVAREIWKSKPKKRADLQKNPDKFAIAVAQLAESAGQVDARRAIDILFKRLRKQRAKTVKKAFAPWFPKG